MDWDPCRADHSIDKATVSITLARPLDGNDLDDAIVSARKIAAQFNLTHRLDQMEPIEISVPPGGQPQPVNINLASAALARRVLFQRLDQGGTPVDEISVSSKAIAVGTLRYRRWVDFFGLLQALLSGVQGADNLFGNLKSVRLEYVDRFESRSPDADHFEVISKASKYLTAAVAGRKWAFHSHSGWFDFETDGVRQLTNANVDVFDPPVPGGHRQITLGTLSQYEALQGVLDEPLRRLDTLHVYLKTLLGDLITPVAANRIALSD